MCLCVFFCQCSVCIFCQYVHFQNIFPPGSLQATETLLEISPVSFIMRLLPLVFFSPCKRCFLTVVSGYFFRYCIKVHLICCPNFPCSCRSIIGEMFQKSTEHKRGNELRRMCPKTHRGRCRWTRQRQKSGWKDEREQSRTERETGESRWAMSMLTFPLAVRIK